MEVATVLEDLVFPCAPRWHLDTLWLGDLEDRTVLRVGSTGRVPVTFLAGDRPISIGWLPDGRLLVAALGGGVLLRQEPNGSLALHADLSRIARGSVQGLAVRGDGTAWVTDLGSRWHEPGCARAAGAILAVTPSGEVEVAADELESPGDLALDDDGQTLLVSERAAARVTAFTVTRTGALVDRRVVAELTGSGHEALASPEGLCVDAAGDVWCADPVGRRVLQLRDGDGVVAELTLDDEGFAGIEPYACALGGSDRRTLFVCAAPGWTSRVASVGRSGRVLAFGV